MACVAAVDGRTESRGRHDSRLAHAGGKARHLWFRLAIPRCPVRSAAPIHTPCQTIRGIRSPGILIPTKIATGTGRHREGKDLLSSTKRSPAGGVRLFGARGPPLGVAPSPTGVGDVDVRPPSSAPSQPEQTLAALPSAHGAGSRLDQRRLPDRTQIGDAQASPMPGQLIDVGDTACTSTAPAPAALPSSSNRARAGCPQTSG